MLVALTGCLKPRYLVECGATPLCGPWSPWGCYNKGVGIVVVETVKSRLLWTLLYNLG